MKSPEYRSEVSGGVHWTIDAGHADLVREGFLADVASLPAKATVVKLLRVKRHLEIEQPDGRYLLKIYPEGGPLGRLKAAMRGSRAQRELDACREAARRGIPVAPLLAAGTARGRSYVVLRRLEGWERLDEKYRALEAEDPFRGRLAFEYGRFCRRIHDAGVHQYDLNPTNVLARSGPYGLELLMTDFERVDFSPALPPARRLEAIGRMDRIDGVSRTDRLRFLAGYSRDPEERARWGQWIRLIRAGRERAVKALGKKVARACVREGRNFGIFRRRRLRGFYRKADPQTGQGGIDPERLAELAADDGRARLGVKLRHAEDAKRAWVAACVAMAEPGGREWPVAVVWIAGSRRGFILYT